MTFKKKVIIEEIVSFVCSKCGFEVTGTVIPSTCRGCERILEAKMKSDRVKLLQKVSSASMDEHGYKVMDGCWNCYRSSYNFESHVYCCFFLVRNEETPVQDGGLCSGWLAENS